jgi:hypothetical protein
MHLKVFLKLENPKNSLLGKYIKKTKNPKKNHWSGLKKKKKKTGFPTLP